MRMVRDNRNPNATRRYVTALRCGQPTIVPEDAPVVAVRSTGRPVSLLNMKPEQPVLPWENVEPATKGLVQRWTKDAKECYESSRNCDDCTIFRNYGRRWLGEDAPMFMGAEEYRKKGLPTLGCKIPMAVQSLLDRKITD